MQFNRKHLQWSKTMFLSTYENFSRELRRATEGENFVQVMKRKRYKLISNF